MSKKEIVVKENVVLMDKLELTGVLVWDIADISDLVDRGIVELNTATDQYYTGTGKRFSRLFVSDKVIDSLKCGVIYAKHGTYGNLQLSVKKDNGCGNLICNTVEEYQAQIRRAVEHLWIEYGIALDVSQSRIKSMEINKTFSLEQDYDSYRRVFGLIMAMLPRKSYLVSQSIWRDRRKSGYQTGSFLATSRKKGNSKKYMEFKIYDKKKQLLGVIKLDEQYVRFEFVLVGTKRIEIEFGSNSFLDITDCAINEWFEKKVNDWIIEPIERWKKQRDDAVMTAMLHFRDNPHNWVGNALAALQDQEIRQGYPVVLDVQEIVPLVSQLDGLKANRRYKIRQRMIASARSVNTMLNNRDDRKLEEVLNKLTDTPLRTQERL